MQWPVYRGLMLRDLAMVLGFAADNLPAVFSRERRPRPLKIGIDQDLVARFPGMNLAAEGILRRDPPRVYAMESVWSLVSPWAHELSLRDSIRPPTVNGAVWCPPLPGMMALMALMDSTLIG